MADQAKDETLTKDELIALIEAHAGKAMAPAITAALGDVTKTQADTAGVLAQLVQSAEDRKKAEDVDASLGKYPYGRKARAVALAALEGVPLDDADGIAKVARKYWPSGYSASIEKWASLVKATLTAGNASTAGAMVMPSYDPEWIELLRNNTVIRGKARTVPMPRGATSKRKQTGAGTAYYQGETDRITPSNLTVGRADLSYKKLTALTVVSNDLLRFSSGEADRIVQEDLLSVSALREDRAFLVGNPPVDSGSPQGIRYQTAAANVAATAGTSLANFQTDLTNNVRLVQASNIPVTPANSGFILSPSTFWTIYALTTTTGDWVFAAGLAQGQPRLLGFPVYLSTQLEVTNSFIGTSSGLNIFAHFPSLEIHDSMSRTVEAFRGGAYYNPDISAVASGISNDETVITCIAEHDFLQVYDKAAAVRTGLAT
jgi:HK97 family phage major capsid protein